jgi:hypothetical protein
MKKLSTRQCACIAVGVIFWQTNSFGDDKKKSGQDLCYNFVLFESQYMNDEATIKDVKVGLLKQFETPISLTSNVNSLEARYNGTSHDGKPAELVFRVTLTKIMDDISIIEVSCDDSATPRLPRTRITRRRH